MGMNSRPMSSGDPPIVSVMMVLRFPVDTFALCGSHQFNHQSTRGHCIMTLEVEMPHPHMPGMKQKGRVYVCDLAGTEPAGDIVYALYDKKVLTAEVT